MRLIKIATILVVFIVIMSALHELSRALMTKALEAEFEDRPSFGVFRMS